MGRFMRHSSNVAEQFMSKAESLLKDPNAYGCDPKCIDHQLYGQGFFNPAMFAICGCMSPIDVDMSTQLFYKTPDMEMMNLINVDTDDM